MKHHPCDSADLPLNASAKIIIHLHSTCVKVKLLLCLQTQELLEVPRLKKRFLKYGNANKVSSEMCVAHLYDVSTINELCI